MLPRYTVPCAQAHLFGADGRKYYAKYMGLLAASVAAYPAAVGIELMNEPPAIQRGAMYETWRACCEDLGIANSSGTRMPNFFLSFILFCFG